MSFWFAALSPKGWWKSPERSNPSNSHWRRTENSGAGATNARRFSSDKPSELFF